ncbi:MAG: nucleotide exchange factor GrpE [Clostridia bacterium]|nr:nucleotide exchange factor GrpE [Clostridia bacterium]
MNKNKEKIENEETTPVEETASEETEEVLEETKETIEKEKYDELYDKYLRTLAEYDNFKKRTQKEKEEMFSLAVAGTIENLLPVADNLDRAILAIKDGESTEFSEGVKMVSKQFYEILEKIGVSEIKAVGEQFDPNIHNAVMHVEDENVDSNVITEEFMKGYKYKDRVIRHSMVKVAN